MAERVSAGFDLLHRLAKEYEKPEFDITAATVGGVEVAVQEQVAIDKPFCRLLRFKRFTDNAEALTRMKTQPTVLVVAPLSGHHSTLLRDTVKSLLHDHKVFITDWTDARMVPVEDGPFHLDDYVEYVQEFIRHIGPEVHVISVCQPTVPVLAAVSLMASRGEATPRTMTMMGGPIDARKQPDHASTTWPSTRATAGSRTTSSTACRRTSPAPAARVYPGFLQHTGFVAMNPNRHVTSHYDYFLDLIRGDDDSAEAHRQFYDEYNAVLDMPAEYYLDTIKTVFQDFALVNGTWEVRGELVRPQDITTHRAADHRRRARRHLRRRPDTRRARPVRGHPEGPRSSTTTRVGAGHYGIFSGRRWREKVYPEVRGFISRFGHETVALAAAHRGEEGARSIIGR